MLQTVGVEIVDENNWVSYLISMFCFQVTVFELLKNAFFAISNWP